MCFRELFMFREGCVLQGPQGSSRVLKGPERGDVPGAGSGRQVHYGPVHELEQDLHLLWAQAGRDAQTQEVMHKHRK